MGCALAGTVITQVVNVHAKEKCSVAKYRVREHGVDKSLLAEGASIGPIASVAWVVHLTRVNDLETDVVPASELRRLGELPSWQRGRVCDDGVERIADYVSSDDREERAVDPAGETHHSIGDGGQDRAQVPELPPSHREVDTHPASIARELEAPVTIRDVDLDDVREVFERVAAGELTPEKAAAWLEEMPILDRDDAKPDIDRQKRTGQPEVIYGPGKSPTQVLAVARALVRADVRPVLLTRASDSQVSAIQEEMPEAVHNELANLVVIRSSLQAAGGTIAVVSAGTSDLPVAEEARRVAEAFGLQVERIVDVGVAGIHRVLQQVPILEAADCVIVVAGMEAALASVVAGLVSTPVVAVPTSVGYGASFGGLAALLGMLTSCVPGVVTVNIDNGLGAAMAAHRIIRR